MDADTSADTSAMPLQMPLQTPFETPFEAHTGSQLDQLDQHGADAETPPNVILVGADWAERSLRRVRFARDLHAPLKLQVGNRYEHFHPTAQRVTVDGHELHVFEWSTFTAVAE